MKYVRYFGKTMMTDKFILCMIALILIAVVILVVVLILKGKENVVVVDSPASKTN